jgi:hypothetical protein
MHNMPMARKYWVYDPHSGGQKIPPDIQKQTTERIMAHARKIRPEYADKLIIHFKNQFCYIDYETEVSGKTGETHLCRIRYLGKPDEWSLAFYTYSQEKYEPSVFASGEWEGTPEEALETGAVFLE